MNATTTLSAAAIVAAGLLGAGVVLRPHASEQDLAARLDAATRPLASRIEKLEEETARLSRERDAALRQGAEALGAALEAKRDLERLKDRQDEVLAALSGAPAAGSTLTAGRGSTLVAGRGPALVAGGPSPDDGASAATPAGATFAGPASPQQIEQIRSALDQIRKEEAAAQQAKWDEQRKRMKEKRLQTFTDKLALTAGQSERLQQIWDETQQRREAAFAGMREGTMSPPDLKQVMVSSREEEDKKVQETLSPAQYDDYQKLQKENPQAMSFGVATATFDGPAVVKEAVIMTAPVGASASGGSAGGAAGK